jgi:uncharacterized membrane protein YfcA
METMFSLLADRMSPGLWVLAGASAVLVGMAKNGVPGLGILVVPMLAMIFPARMSIGALLPLLIVGDILAIIRFRAHADLSVLRRLLPWTLAGIAGGAGVLLIVDAGALRPLLGGLVLLLVVMELVRKAGWFISLPHRRGASPVLGLLAGVATTVGNAAGPLLNLYLLSRDFVRHRFIGTAAWFFFIVNMTKVPVYAGLGIFTAETWLFDALMMHFVVLGAFVGRAVLKLVSDTVFTWIVLVLSIAAALKLLAG